jgi:hypothetical protein
VRARRAVTAVFAIALAVGAPTSITHTWHRTTVTTQADPTQPTLDKPTGGYPGTYEPTL